MTSITFRKVLIATAVIAAVGVAACSKKTETNIDNSTTAPAADNSMAPASNTAAPAVDNSAAPVDNSAAPAANAAK